MKQIHIGLIGFGTVGAGVVKVLKNNKDVIETRLGTGITLKKIVDLDIETDRGVEVDRSILSTDVNDVLADPEIDIVLELIGGEEPAMSFIVRALESGKHVVTANKALLAKRGNEIFEIAHKSGTDIAYEAAVCGGIPIIRSLKEGLAANNITSIQGIVNGTSNYILTEMTQRGEDFQAVLARAQQMGYAEADPTFDVEGIDAAHKISLLTALAYGTRIRFDDIYVEGISEIEPMDIAFARELGYVIKLLALSKNGGDSLEVRVHPAMAPIGSPMSTVDGVFNALSVEGDAVGTTFYYGMGAGMMPTASAVVGDVMELSRGLVKGVTQRVPSLSHQWDNLSDLRIRPMEEIRTNYYLRFEVHDRPGVLSTISGVLAEYEISLLSVVQKGRRVAGGGVPVVMMTHEAREEGVQKALAKIDALPVTVAKTRRIRVEDEMIRDKNL